MLQQDFIFFRKKYIEQQFSHLNPMQRDAVLHTEGPLLILAGAGSGKTTVIVNRIGNLLRFGRAWSSEELPDCAEQLLPRLCAAVENNTRLSDTDELALSVERPAPFSVLAITFTNKAADEMKTRICSLTGGQGEDVSASTFHSACARFLRHDAPLLGLPASYTIYDTDDSVRLMKTVYANLGMDDKLFPIKQMLSRIGRIKDQMVSPQEFEQQSADFATKQVSAVYSEYQKQLADNGALDFDDLIYSMVRVLEQNESARDYYRRRFKYILVDEYQDTSFAQYRLVELLAGERKNVCVVGDDDQSIYRFRGASIENILNFEKHFHGAQIIRLEQNYRSCANILDTANHIIENNRSRKGKTLWTDKEQGDKVCVYTASDEQAEAAFIAETILSASRAPGALSECAVLYRMNAQSNAIETYFSRAGIPYRVVGGRRFYDHTEVKDILAYLCIVANPGDEVRLFRIINRPARKIGDSTIGVVSELARDYGCKAMDIIKNAGSYPKLSRARQPLENFALLYEELCDIHASQGLAALTSAAIERTGYAAMLLEQGSEGVNRLENVNELLSSVVAYCEATNEPSLDEFLEQIALISAVDESEDAAGRVTLMTLHCAKGLEFDTVFIAGMEEGIFPSEMSKTTSEDIEEERRLMYVGVTRARKKLYLSCCEKRLLFGSTRRNRRSRFIDEIGEDTVEFKGIKRAKSYAQPINVTFGSTPQTRSSTAEQPRPQRTGEVYVPGDRVRHSVFGDGTVVSAREMGLDVLLEIDFDTRGIKKTMQNYSPLTRL